MPNWIKPVCATAVVVLALVSVLVALGHMSHSVWYDESQTRLIARQGTLGGVTALAMQERPYPPLFFFAVHYSLLLRDDETGLRLPAAVFGALTVLAVFLLGSELVDSLTGAVAAFFFVLTPGAFRYFVDGNAYTLLMLASALSTLYLWRAARSDAMRDWAIYALFALVGLGTHSLFVFHLGAQVLAGIFLRTRSQPAAGRSYRRLTWVMGPLLGTALLWSAVYSRIGGDLRPVKFTTVFDVSTVVAMAGMYFGPQSFGSLPALALWAVLQLVGVTYLYRSGRSGFWALAIMVAVPLVAITVFAKLTLSYVAYRYGLGAFPLACVVAACAWKVWPERLAARAGVVLVIVAYWVSGAAFIASAGENTFGYQDWRGATAFLAGRWSTGDPVVIAGKGGLLPFAYYWKGPRPAHTGRNPSEVSDRLVRSFSSSGTTASRAWVMLSGFANEKSLVARFTESRRWEDEAQGKGLAELLEKRGLRVCQTAAFQRVKVLEVRRGACQTAP